MPSFDPNYTVENCPICFWTFHRARAQQDRQLCRACESRHKAANEEAARVPDPCDV